MAFKLAEAYVQLSSRGFSGVSRGLGAIGGKLKSLVNPAAMVASAFAAIGAAGGTGAMLKLAADAERLGISLETIFGSAEKAAKMLDEINAFAAKTPFEQMELGQASKVLAGFRVEQEQIIPVLTQLGDVAAITDARLGDLVAIYGKLKSKGRLTMEELNQLAERGAASMQDFADVLGIPMEQLPKKIERGEIKFREFEKVLRALTSEGGRFAGGMEKLSTTTSGLWSTFTGNMKRLLAELGADIIEAFDIKELIANAGQAADKLIAKLEDFKPTLYAIADAFKDMGSDIAAIMEDTGPLLKDLVASLPIVSQMLADVSGALRAINEELKLLDFFSENSFLGFLRRLREWEGGAVGMLGKRQMLGWDEEPGKPSPATSPATIPAAGPKASAFAVTGLAALANQMQSEAGKRLAERTAVAAEGIKAGIDQLNQKMDRGGVTGHTGQFMPATG